MFGSGPVDGVGGLRAAEAGRPASAPTTSTRTRATAWRRPAGFTRTFGIDEPMGLRRHRERRRLRAVGLEHGGDAPILWPHHRPPPVESRLRRCGAIDLRAPVPARPADKIDLHAAVRSGDPNYISQLHHPQAPGIRPFVKKHVKFDRATDIGWPATQTTLRRKAVEQRLPWQGRRPRATQHAFGAPFEEYAKFVASTPPRRSRSCPACLKELGQALAKLYADPEGQGDVVLDHGLQPAHTRGTWANNMVYNIHLLVARSASQATAVLADRPASVPRHGARGGAPSPTACRPTWW